MGSLPTKLQLAQHLCLSLNTTSRDRQTNYTHSDRNTCGDHSGACCHCWAAANVMMQVIEGVADKAREEGRETSRIPNPWRTPLPAPAPRPGPRVEYKTWVSDRT